MTEALRQLGVAARVQLEFCCDKDPACRKFLQKVHKPKYMYEDVVGRDVASMPAVDIYSAGFPCQPWSLAGLQQGRHDKHGRGKIIDYIMEYITQKSPKVAILENVASITYKCHKKAFTRMLGTLRQSGKYLVTWRILDASKFGIPQHRPRIFIVAFLRSAMVSPGFFWPSPNSVLTPLPVERFLCGGAGVFPKLAGKAVDKLKQGLETIKQEGGNWSTTTYALDVFSGFGCHARMQGRVPCLTRSRAGRGGFYITSVKRLLTVEEMLQLMGLPTSYRQQGPAAGLSDRQMGLMVGNAICTNVLKAIMARVLHKIGKHQ